MSRKGGFLFLVLVLLIQSASAQYFNFYSGDNAFGESLYGLKDEHGLEITKPIWKSHYKYEVFQFGEPLGVVSEDGENYFLINLLGERVSLFSFPESYVIEDMRMKYSGDMKIDFRYATDNHLEHINYYYLNEECACDPRPYYPCPARFPMDTVNASEVIKQVQQMQFVLEFYNIDSAFAVCNALIDENPRIPEYHFYKAWLIDHAFMYSYFLFMGHEYDDEFPKYMWDELIRLRDKDLIGSDEKRQAYLEQYELLQLEIKKLDKRGSWLDRNKKYANQFIIDQDDYYAIDEVERYVDWENNYELRKGSYYLAIDALIQMLIYEKEEEFVLKAKAWQHQILGNFYWTYPSLDNQSGPFRTLYNQTEKELLQSPQVYEVLRYEKVGTILRFNAVSRNRELGFGLGLNLGVVTRINRIRTTEYSVGIGYNHYFLNNTLGEYFLDLTVNPAGWLEMRLSPSFLTNYDGIKGVGFLPTVGLRVWDIYLSYGYNIVNKSKFGDFRGHSFGLSYSYVLFNSSTFYLKADGYEL